MSERYLGPLPFDIHAGGLDLIFPHHENEIAQSCCAHGLDLMARFWLHNGFVEMTGEKMAKSVGNVLRLEEALNGVALPRSGEAIGAPNPGEVLRLWLLGTHYRQPIDCTSEALDEARRERRRFYNTLDEAGVRTAYPGGSMEADSDVITALEDDLNTSDALNRLRELRRDLSRASDSRVRNDIVSRLRASGVLFGLLQNDPDFVLRNIVKVETGELKIEVERLLEERRVARARKDFKRADEIREVLTTQGVLIKDRPDGTTDWQLR
jgi:cysteinyl-tRNA synthetase